MKTIICIDCGKEIEAKCNSQKRCVNCAIKATKEYDREYMKIFRKRTKTKKIITCIDCGKFEKVKNISKKYCYNCAKKRKAKQYKASSNKANLLLTDNIIITLISSESDLKRDEIRLCPGLIEAKRKFIKTKRFIKQQQQQQQ